MPFANKDYWREAFGKGRAGRPYEKLGGSYDPRTGSGQVPLDPQTFMPRRLPDGSIAWDVQHQVNAATAGYNRAQRDAAQNAVINSLLAGTQARPGSRTQAAMGAAQGLANVHLQSQIEPENVMYWGYQDELRKRRKEARKSSYIQAGATILGALAAAPFTGGASLAMGLPMAAAGMTQPQLDIESQDAGGRYMGPTPQTQGPGLGTPGGPAGGPTSPMGESAPTGQAGFQGKAPPPPGVAPGAGGPEGAPEGGPTGMGGGPEAGAAGMVAGMGVGAMNAYGEGLTKSEAVVADIAQGLGVPPSAVVQAAVEADPTLLTDNTIDGFLYRVQRLRQGDRAPRYDEGYDDEEVIFGRPYRDESYAA